MPVTMCVIFFSALSGIDDSVNLQCNTEKDKQNKLNHHMAGMVLTIDLLFLILLEYGHVA